MARDSTSRSPNGFNSLVTSEIDFGSMVRLFFLLCRHQILGVHMAPLAPRSGLSQPLAKRNRNIPFNKGKPFAGSHFISQLMPWYLRAEQKMLSTGDFVFSRRGKVKKATQMKFRPKAQCSCTL